MDLRPYQIDDLNFLMSLNTAGIFNEQRTGKTPTALKVLEAKHCNKNIIVAPASTLYQWAEEYKKWLNKDCVVIAGTPKQVSKAISEWKEGAIISYDLFKDTKTHTGKVHDILKAKPDAIILDEAHKIKNPKAEVTKAAFLCTKIPVRYALTGTPAPNKAHEIFSILHFLKPERYNSYWKFIDEYFYKITAYGNGREYIDIGGFKKNKDTQLQNELNKFCVSRKRKDVMPWLPEKDYFTVKLEPTKEQKKYLEELTRYFETEHIITQGILDRLIRYRQICLAPEILNLQSTSPKTAYIIQYIKDNPNEPLLIFSKFTTYLKDLNRIFKHSKLISGDTPKEERNNIVKDFQSGKFNILLLQMDTAKEGLTLDRAETVIFTDKYPPVGDVLQAEDRFVATTEANKEKPHTVITLVMKDTYDEIIEDLIKHRASEIDVINNFKKYIGGI